MSTQDDDNSTKVYCTVDDLTEDEICKFLVNDAAGTVEEVKEQFSIILVPGQRPLQIFKHQRDTYKVPNYGEQSYFLIVDSANATKDGVLLCNLKAEHGFADAVRNLPNMACMTAMSLSIANSNWTEVREGTWHEQEPPVRRPAVYDNRKKGDRDSFHPLADAVDVGVHYVNDEGEPRSVGSIDDLFRYVAISLDESCDTDKLVKQHQRHAEEKSLDSNLLAVVDDKFAAEGALLVQAEPRKELRCKPPVAGELLYWHEIGFMDWDEMEDFASKHSDFEKRLVEQRTSGAQTADPENLDTKEAGPDEPCEDKGQQALGGEGGQGSEERRFRYYRTRSGMVIASIEPHEIPTTFSRPRQESDGLDENGEMGAVEDTMLEELPWDYYLKKDAAEEGG
ncbi:hypothetical protein V500_07035 [Pseudogymnoascus sp. VKM F-4518 (FW-2643)]|nr:hypothetical protein V500_07035 [Pseudogymnoascus sp. VKM F-4518 (FW-2643)]